MCAHVLRERRRRLRGEGLRLHLLRMSTLKVDVKWCASETDSLELHNRCLGVSNVEILHKSMILMSLWHRQPLQVAKRFKSASKLGFALNVITRTDIVR